MAKRNSKGWNLLLEFATVVIGILLAFQLNTCKENKAHEKLVTSHVQSILEETELNQTQIEASIENSERLLQQLDSLISLVQQPESSVTKMSRMSFQLMNLDYMYLKKNAYQSFIETGDVRYMKDKDFQDAIISLYEYYDWMEGLDSSTRENYLNNYLPYATEKFDLITYQPESREVYTNKLFKNYLSVYRYTIVYRLKKQKEVEERVSQFVATTAAIVATSPLAALAEEVDDYEYGSVDAPIGIAVVGGMISAAFIAIFFIPLFYVAVERLFHKEKTDDADKADV